jgi:hypothetical protein
MPMAMLGGGRVRETSGSRHPFAWPTPHRMASQMPSLARLVIRTVSVTVAKNDNIHVLAQTGSCRTGEIRPLLRTWKIRSPVLRPVPRPSRLSRCLRSIGCQELPLGREEVAQSANDNGNAGQSSVRINVQVGHLRQLEPGSSFPGLTELPSRSTVGRACHQARAAPPPGTRTHKVASVHGVPGRITGPAALFWGSVLPHRTVFGLQFKLEAVSGWHGAKVINRVFTDTLLAR